MCMLTLMISGCAAPQLTETRCISNIDKQQAVAAADQVLAGMHFRFETIDEQRGILRARALPAAQFFELWRADNVTGKQAFEANIHSIRRTATIQITEENKRICIDCTVTVHRLSRPEPLDVSQMRAFSIFAREKSDITRIEYQRQEEPVRWIDLGRDSKLEAEIINLIIRNLQKGTEG